AIEDWMPLVHQVERCFPHTVLEIQVGEGDAPMRWLLREEADLAVIIGRCDNRLATQIEAYQLGEMEFVTVVDARCLVSNSDDDVAALPQILVADYEDAVTGYGVVEGHRHWRVSDHRIKAALIAAGKGWGSLPWALAEPALKTGRLAPVSYRGMPAHTQQPYFLCRKLNRALGPVAGYIWNGALAGAPQ
ncbi:MAG TPA: LysR substrate-binding domain-containing protein, partial [Polyangiales bacterium]